MWAIDLQKRETVCNHYYKPRPFWLGPVCPAAFPACPVSPAACLPCRPVCAALHGLPPAVSLPLCLPCLPFS